MVAIEPLRSALTVLGIVMLMLYPTLFYYGLELVLKAMEDDDLIDRVTRDAARVVGAPRPSTSRATTRRL